MNTVGEENKQIFESNSSHFELVKKEVCTRTKGSNIPARLAPPTSATSEASVDVARKTRDGYRGSKRQGTSVGTPKVALYAAARTSFDDRFARKVPMLW